MQEMKKLIAMLLMLVMCLSLCACHVTVTTSGDEDKEAAEAVEEEKEEAEEKEAPAEDAKKDSADMTKEEKIEAERNAKLEKELPDKAVRALVEKYVDLSGYSEGSLINYDAIVEKPVTSVTVDGKELVFGCSYSDVIAKGFEPEFSSFADKTLSSFISFVTFTAPSGKYVDIGFAGEENTKISDAKLAYVATVRSSDDYEDADYDMEGITYGTSFQKLLDRFGLPYKFRQEKLDDGSPALEVSFYDEEGDFELVCKIDPSDATVAWIGVSISDS